jgi:hypothetical protein
VSSESSSLFCNQELVQCVMVCAGAELGSRSRELVYGLITFIYTNISRRGRQRITLYEQLLEGLERH